MEAGGGRSARRLHVAPRKGGRDESHNRGHIGGRGRVSVPSAPATSFGPVRQIEAGDLDVGYVDAGPRDGPAVLLLHGWPYDIRSFAETTPILTAAGLHVIVPYLRGYGSTRFLAHETPRNGEQAALAADAIALLDALGIGQAIVAGFDWAPALRT
jgi:hypothetical protein